MNLLESFNQYSTCPLCDIILFPTLELFYKNIGVVHYTLTDFKYPLVFTKKLEFSDYPMTAIISENDILLNSTSFKISDISLWINCPNGNHYNCKIFKYITKSRNIENTIIYPSIFEKLKTEKYLIQRSATLTEICLRNNWLWNFGDKMIFRFDKNIPLTYWPIKNMEAFDMKINKLMVLK